VLVGIGAESKSSDEILCCITPTSLRENDMMRMSFDGQSGVGDVAKIGLQQWSSSSWRSWLTLKLQIKTHPMPHIPIRMRIAPPGSFGQEVLVEKIIVAQARGSVL
jgi:hypothetical protein